MLGKACLVVWGVEDIVQRHCQLHNSKGCPKVTCTTHAWGSDSGKKQDTAGRGVQWQMGRTSCLRDCVDNVRSELCAELPELPHVEVLQVYRVVHGVLQQTCTATLYPQRLLS